MACPVGVAVGDVTVVGSAVDVDGDAGQRMAVVRVGDCAGDERGAFQGSVNGGGCPGSDGDGVGLAQRGAVVVVFLQVVAVVVVEAEFVRPTHYAGEPVMPRAVGVAAGGVTVVGGAVEVDGDAGQGMTVVRVGDGAGDEAGGR